MSVHPGDSVSAEGLIRNADAALSRARELGGNAFQFFKPEMYARTAKNLAMETDLRRSLERGDFVLHYQPQFDLGTGTIIGAEALVRWMHPQRVSCLRGIHPLAEETGLIVPLGEQVLRTACAQAKAWHDGGLPPPADRRQFLRPPVSARGHGGDGPSGAGGDGGRSALARHRADRELHHEEPRGGHRVPGELKRLGILVSVDDFGTGYSSLAHLKRFPIDVIKVDQSFVRNVTADANDAAIAAAIVTMAHTLGMRVIAEGVETEAQAAFLRARLRRGAGVPLQQAPPAVEFLKFVEEKNRQAG